MHPSCQKLSKQGHHLICQSVNLSMTKHFSKLFWVKIFEELVKPWVMDTDEVVNIKLKVFLKFSFDFFIDHKFNLINKLAS